jgi:NADPH2:quinone reductase
MKNKKVVLVATGGPEVLKVVEDEVPEPGENELRIRTEYAGVAFADIMMRHGKYPGSPKVPFTPGYDIVGRVDSLGKGASHLKIGQKVAALTRFGGYAHYICIAQEKVVIVPDKANSSDTVCLVLNYITAYQMLHRIAKVKPGQNILIHSAAGGVGTALLQLGKTLGLKMYGTASRRKHNTVKKFGGIPIDYKQYDFVAMVSKHEPEGVDAVFDPVGGDHCKRSLKVVKKGGILVGFGALAMFENGRITGSIMGTIIKMMGLKVFSGRKNFTFYGINIDKHPDWYKEDLSKILHLYLKGDIKPVIGKILPLEEVQKAHVLLSEGKIIGKILLDCRGDD